MKQSNFWTDHFPYPGEMPTSGLPASTDVAIIGSGYTGLNAALELRKSGVDVTVLEQHTTGWGASSRNGGMLTPGLKASAKSIVKSYGVAQGKIFWDWAWDSITYVSNLVEEEGIDCDWLYSGFAELYHKPSHEAAGESYLKFLRDQFNFRGFTQVSRDELASEIGSTAYYGAYTGNHAAGLQPAKYVFGLAMAAGRRGAHLVEHAAVTRITRTRSGFELTTPGGTILAREVLMATNGYTTSVAPRLLSGIFPVGSYIIVTEPLPEDLQESVSPRGRMFYDSKHFLNYFRLTPDGRMLFGGRNNLSTDLDLQQSAELLQQRMLEVFPQLQGIAVTHTWTGKLGITFDQIPHTGRLNGIHYAYGYGGHGISIASYLGREAGQLIAGTRTDSPFLQIRHPRNIAAHFDRYFLPLVASYYRFLDRVS